MQTKNLLNPQGKGWLSNWGTVFLFEVRGSGFGVIVELGNCLTVELKNWGGVRGSKFGVRGCCRIGELFNW